MAASGESSSPGSHWRLEEKVVMESVESRGVSKGRESEAGVDRGKKKKMHNARVVS